MIKQRDSNSHGEESWVSWEEEQPGTGRRIWEDRGDWESRRMRLQERDSGKAQSMSEELGLLKGSLKV